MRPFEKQLQKWGVPESKWANIRASMERRPGPRTMRNRMRHSAAISGLEGEARDKVEAMLRRREAGCGNETPEEYARRTLALRRSQHRVAQSYRKQRCLFGGPILHWPDQ